MPYQVISILVSEGDGGFTKNSALCCVTLSQLNDNLTQGGRAVISTPVSNLTKVHIPFSSYTV